MIDGVDVTQTARIAGTTCPQRRCYSTVAVSTRRIWIAMSLAVFVAAAAFVMWPRRERDVTDLLQAFAAARKQPSDASFSVRSVTIDGTTKPAIVAEQQTRLTYHVTLPKHARFRVALAFDRAAVGETTETVLFLIGVSDGRTYQTRVSRTVSPGARSDDRRWHEETVDLEEYAGLTVDLVLNTRAGSDSAGQLRGHAAVWGAPRIVAR
jgi:hypothetical protein